MSLALVVLAPLALVSAAPPVPGIHRPPALSGHPDAPSRNCRGRIEQARQDLGQLKLDGHDATADKPLMIYAVDRMIDGCEVLVMRNNLADIRPLPDFHGGSGKMVPAH